MSAWLRFWLAVAAAGSLFLGVAWIKFELIDKAAAHPGPWWPAAIWVGAAVALFAAAASPRPLRERPGLVAAVGIAAFAALVMAGLVVYAISRLD